MKVVVTGGDGFVGRHLVTLLIGQGHEVTATSLLERPDPTALPAEIAGAVDWTQLDVREPDALDRLFAAERPRWIFHLAGHSSSVEVRRDAAQALRVNGEGTLHVIEAVARVGDPATVIVAGSADAYGRGVEGRIGERTPLRPESLYGATKAAQDVIARGAGRALGVDVRVARLFPLIGPGQRDVFVVPSFCRRALSIREGRREPRMAVGNLDVSRDFADVRDGVKALVALAELDAAPHRAFNVCTGRGTPVRAVLDAVLAAAGIDPEVVEDPALRREGEPLSVVGDPSRLREATGWRVERDLHVAVQDTLDWLADSSMA